jgi:hypothetical protein
MVKHWKVFNAAIVCIYPGGYSDTNPGIFGHLLSYISQKLADDKITAPNYGCQLVGRGPAAERVTEIRLAGYSVEGVLPLV